MRRIVVILSLLLSSISIVAAAEEPAQPGTFSNDGLGGLWRALARNGTGFRDRFHDTAYICNGTGNLPITIASAPVTNTSAPPPWSSDSIAPGKCSCISGPASLFVENVGASQEALNGTYAWMSRKTCAAAPTVSPGVPSLPSGGDPFQANCKPLSHGEYYATVCEAILPPVPLRYRLCFGPDWVHVSAGPAYPTRFVRLLVDRNLLKSPVSPNLQYDIRWSFLAKGCVDLAHAHKVWFAIHGDSNYSAQNVDHINFTVKVAQ
jgi:hypothetical protein